MLTDMRMACCLRNIFYGYCEKLRGNPATNNTRGLECCEMRFCLVEKRTFLAILVDTERGQAGSLQTYLN